MLPPVLKQIDTSLGKFQGIAFVVNEFPVADQGIEFVLVPGYIPAEFLCLRHEAHAS
jgi:hypothetical protein